MKGSINKLKKSALKRVWIKRLLRKNNISYSFKKNEDLGYLRKLAKSHRIIEEESHHKKFTSYKQS